MRFFIIVIVSISFSGLYAQKPKAKAGPVIKDFGKVYSIKNPDLNLQKNKVYKVIFDVYSDTAEPNSINPFINTVARFLNMHGQNGIKAKNMKIVMVLHGAAAKNVVKDATHMEKYQVKNPNTALLKTLKKANVEIFVCGQSLAARGFEQRQVSKNVKIALSAMTALVSYQDKGYNIINFN